MLTKKKRWFAAALVAAMLCTSVSPAVAHAEETAVSTHNHGIYTATADLMDKKGVVTLKDLTWDEIVVPASLGASKVVLKNVIATKVVVEDASLCDIEILGGSIAMIELVKEEKKLTLRDMAELIASGMTKAEAQKAYQAAKDELAKKQAKTPVVALKDKAVVGTLTVIGSEGRLAVDGFTGTLVVEQTAKSGNGYGMMELELNNSKPAKVEVSGKGKNSLVVTGTNSSIAEAVVDGSASLVLEVETKKLETAKDSTEVELVVLAPVEEVVINGEATDLNVTSDVVVKKAVINGANATVEGAGKVESAAVSDDSAKVTTSGTEVYDPAKATATPAPTATPKPTTAPSSGGSGSSGGGSYYPPYVPGPTATPKPTVTPTPGATSHVHSWDEGVLTPATCTEGGYTTHTCKNCKETKQEFAEKPLGHTVETWEQGELIGGCTYERTGYCTTCKQNVTSDITMDIHVKTKVVINPAATCKNAGTKNYVCTVCGETIDTETYSNPDAHDWGTPIEGENGKMVSTCGDCGATKFVVVMTESGVSGADLDVNTEITVGDVNMSLDKNVLQQVNAASGAALQLSADTLTTEEKAELLEKVTSEDNKNLLENGVIYDFNMAISGTETFKFNGDVTVSIPYELAEGEDPDGIEVWYVKSDGTIETALGTYHDGYVSFATNHFSIFALVHLTLKQICAKYGCDPVTITVDPTCTEDGYKINICKRCGETTITDGTTAAGHKIWVQYLKNADCQNAGLVKYFCKNCDYVTELETPKGSHTAGSDGKCTGCGATVCSHANHYLLVELEDGSNSCLDGVLVTKYCPECESVVEEFIKKSHYEKCIDVLNLWPYGEDAAGYVALLGCACGAVGPNFIREFKNGNAWTYQSSSYTDASGTWHYVNSYTCGTVVVQEDYTILSQNGCYNNYNSTWSVSVDGEVMDEISAKVTKENHCIAEKGKLLDGSVTCEDGMEYTRYCLNCNAEFGTYTTYEHYRVVKKAINISDYAPDACGGYLLYEMCPCGESVFYTQLWDYTSCDFEWSDEDYTYHCANCDFRFVDNGSGTTTSADGTKTKSVTYTFYWGDTLLDTYTDTIILPR